jgi:bacterioferritin-associated ferredoxin
VACHPLPSEEIPGPRGRAMTRCECAEVSFEEIAQQIERERSTLEEQTRRTGCGGNCTACLPDLRRFLAKRG